VVFLFDCLVFLSVSIDYKQYANSIRDLIVLPLFFFFFILHLDLTIGLIHVIAQQIQKIRERASLLGETCRQLKSA